jgi:hypothetical protein
MSIFPTKILLATDGSTGAELAAETASELAKRTGSELHVVHVFGIMPWYPVYPEGTALGETEPEEPLVEELRATSQGAARYGGGEDRLARRDRGTGTPRGGRTGPGDRRPGRGYGRWNDSSGQQGPRRDKTRARGKRLGLGREARPLPRYGGPKGEGTLSRT